MNMVQSGGSVALELSVGTAEEWGHMLFTRTEHPEASVRLVDLLPFSAAQLL